MCAREGGVLGALVFICTGFQYLHCVLRYFFQSGHNNRCGSKHYLNTIIAIFDASRRQLIRFGLQLWTGLVCKVQRTIRSGWSNVLGVQSHSNVSRNCAFRPFTDMRGALMWVCVCMGCLRVWCFCYLRVYASKMHPFAEHARYARRVSCAYAINNNPTRRMGRRENSKWR